MLCVVQAQHHVNVEAILYGKCSVFMPCLLTEQQLADRLAMTLVAMYKTITIRSKRYCNVTLNCFGLIRFFYGSFPMSNVYFFICLNMFHHYVCLLRLQYRIVLTV